MRAIILTPAVPPRGRWLAALFIVATGSTAFAQTCPGAGESWGAFSDSESQPPHNDGSVPAEAVPGILETLQRLVGPFSVLNPRPLIGQTKTHTRSIQARMPRPDGLWAYEARGRFYPRGCNTASGQLDTLESLINKALVTEVHVNSLHLLLRDLGLPIGGRPVYSLARTDGVIGGYPTFASEWVSSGRAVLFVQGRKSPFRTVSQRQYLQALLQRLDETATGHASLGDETETFVQQLIEEAKAMPPGDMREQMLTEYERTLAEYRASRPATTDALSTGVAGDVMIIRRYLETTPATMLDSPAITFHSAQFTGSFPDETDEGAYRLVQVDEMTFDRGRPGAPQMVVFLWAWSEDKPATAAWRSGMETAFPLDELQRIVDGAN